MAALTVGSLGTDNNVPINCPLVIGTRPHSNSEPELEHGMAALTVGSLGTDNNVPINCVTTP
ncbi:hypothetical protein J6590_092428 [Homalodisca vitripennis]|nr:hypothetical protein J6590_092427 [Homalodisca vitripennis]KAG8314471.1 hypothetical protein J6590_092428 [Homalodisca vitripennis]